MYSPPLIWEGFFPTASKGDEFSIISKRREQIGMPFMEEVQFINRGYSGFYDAASTKYLVQQLPGVKPYTEARFFVSSWGTLGDFAYPQVSYFEVYPMPKQSAGALPSAVIRVMVSVTSFTISTNEVPSILPTDLARVTDHRISTTAGPLTYLTTNLFIQPNSSTAIAAIKNFDRRSKDKNEIEMPATKFDSALLRATICLAFFLPLIWIFIHNKKQQTKNTTKL
jgi:hypothetical protein